MISANEGEMSSMLITIVFTYYIVLELKLETVNICFTFE